MTTVHSDFEICLKLSTVVARHVMWLSSSTKTNVMQLKKSNKKLLKFAK